MSKKPSFKDIINDDKWGILDIEHWIVSDIYVLRAVHEDGTTLEIKEDRKTADEFIKKLSNE